MKQIVVTGSKELLCVHFSCHISSYPQSFSVSQGEWLKFDEIVLDYDMENESCYYHESDGWRTNENSFLEWFP